MGKRDMDKLEQMIGDIYETVFGNDYDESIDEYLMRKENKVKQLEERDMRIVHELMKMKDMSEKILSARNMDTDNADERIVIERYQTIRDVCIRILYLFGIDLYDE